MTMYTQTPNLSASTPPTEPRTQPPGILKETLQTGNRGLPVKDLDSEQTIDPRLLFDAHLETEDDHGPAFSLVAATRLSRHDPYEYGIPAIFHDRVSAGSSRCPSSRLSNRRKRGARTDEASWLIIHGLDRVGDSSKSLAMALITAARGRISRKS